MKTKLTPSMTSKPGTAAPCARRAGHGADRAARLAMIKRAALLWLLAALTPQLSIRAQSTAFTYQGQLNDTGASATGSYDISFAAYDAATSGNLVSAMVTNSAIMVSNGAFTTTVDFGSGIFAGSDLWLEIAVSTNGAGTFSLLAPRQRLAPVPYAIYSSTAGTAATASTVTSGAVSASQLNTIGAPGSGQVLGFNGSQLVWQDPIVGGNTGGWALTGNLGTIAGANFVGTLDTQPLELKVGGARAMRLEPDTSGSGSPNVIGGSGANYVSNSVVGAAIGGGGGVNYSNSVTASYATIGGGVKNLAAGMQSVVGGGYQNSASGYISAVAGGAYNVASSSEAFVGAGAYNGAASFAVVGGGLQNSASGNNSFIGGGAYNFASGNYAVVGGGGNQFSFFSGNSAGGDFSVISGGSENSTAGKYSAIAGGWANTATGDSAIVAGGYFNTASGDYSFAAGTGANALHRGTFVWADSQLGSLSSVANNQFLIRAGNGVGIGTAQTPPGGLRVASGGLAVTGASSPNYSGAAGVFIEKAAGVGAVFAYDYTAGGPLSLGLNSPGGKVGVGTLSPAYTLDVNGTTRTHSVIITGGADVAEPFKIGGEEIAKGSVVVIDKDHPGELKVSSREYDTKVAGIVSGANGINPGIALHQDGALEGGQNVALSGRVYVLADATAGVIEPGDLLTTSSTPGHAMKVADHLRAQGAVIGKAMTGLEEGKGMVLVLVTLQ